MTLKYIQSSFDYFLTGPLHFLFFLQSFFQKNHFRYTLPLSSVSDFRTGVICFDPVEVQLQVVSFRDRRILQNQHHHTWISAPALHENGRDQVLLSEQIFYLFSPVVTRHKDGKKNN